MASATVAPSCREQIRQGSLWRRRLRNIALPRPSLTTSSEHRTLNVRCSNFSTLPMCLVWVLNATRLCVPGQWKEGANCTSSPCFSSHPKTHCTSIHQISMIWSPSHTISIAQTSMTSAIHNRVVNSWNWERSSMFASEWNVNLTNRFRHYLCNLWVYTHIQEPFFFTCEYLIMYLI
jgi:hypothetical protein